MSVAVITGSSGLIGSQCVEFLSDKGLLCAGIDNNMRETFFGKGASTLWNLSRLKQHYPGFIYYDADIRHREDIGNIFKKYSKDISLIIHAAAQPSHDYAATDPLNDFTVNANGTLNMLEHYRKYCPEAVFIFTSTNKVYGDLPNHLPLVEHETRYEVDTSHPYFEHGISESMSIDQNLHSLFGVSKASADLMVQEYGRYFGMRTAVFRGGCLTGPSHSGTELHGFLSYLVECLLKGKEYTVYGYKGKQVRDNIHSLDLVNMFWEFFKNPRSGEVYNAGGSRHSHSSLLEAIQVAELKTGYKMKLKISEQSRIGDHQWYVSDVSKFKRHFPSWHYTYDFDQLLDSVIDGTRLRLSHQHP